MTTLPPSYAHCDDVWEPQPPGNVRACPGLSWDCFTFTFTLILYIFRWERYAVSLNLQGVKLVKINTEHGLDGE